jgi:hypothetical protein
MTLCGHNAFSSGGTRITAKFAALCDHREAVARAKHRFDGSESRTLFRRRFWAFIYTATIKFELSELGDYFHGGSMHCCAACHDDEQCIVSSIGGTNTVLKARAIFEQILDCKRVIREQFRDPVGV